MSSPSTVVASSGPPGLSFSAYARHRGCGVTAVSRAIKRGRLKKSVVYDSTGKAWIADVGLADQEWVRNSSLTTAPPAVRERLVAARAQLPPRPPPADGVPRPRDEDNDDLTLTQATAVEKRWRAKIVELEYRKKAAELVPALEVKARLVDVFSSCRAKLLGVPTRAKQRLPHLSKKDVIVLDELVREALEALAQEGSP